MPWRVEAPDGTLYGFRGNGDTEVVWEDEFLFEEFPDMMGAYQDWDMLGPCMEVAVVPGQEEEAPPEGSFTAEQWRYAEQITVTWVDPEMYSAEAAAGRSAKPGDLPVSRGGDPGLCPPGPQGGADLRLSRL